MIAHIVLFTPKVGLTRASIMAFATSMHECFVSCPTIARAAVGPSIVIDPGYRRSMGESTYGYAAVLEFDDKTGLVEYLRHPAHEALGRLFWEHCERTVVTEVETADAKDPNIVKFLVERL
jgi:Stress responsive A/B Barrel Domain